MKYIPNSQHLKHGFFYLVYNPVLRRWVIAARSAGKTAGNQAGKTADICEYKSNRVYRRDLFWYELDNDELLMYIAGQL